MSDEVKLIDVANLIFAGTSFIVALVALKISNKVARMSISRPFVIEKLHDLFEYLKTRRLSDDPIKDVDRLMDEVQRIRRLTLVLEQAGFGLRVHELEAKVLAFSETRKELEVVLTSGNQITEEQRRKLLKTAGEMDKPLQALLADIETMLRKIMKDPIKD